MTHPDREPNNMHHNETSETNERGMRRKAPDAGTAELERSGSGRPDSNSQRGRQAPARRSTSPHRPNLTPPPHPSETRTACSPAAARSQQPCCGEAPVWHPFLPNSRPSGKCSQSKGERNAQPAGSAGHWLAEAPCGSASPDNSARVVGDPDCAQPCCRPKPAALLRGSTGGSVNDR